MRRAFTLTIVASWVMLVALLVHKHAPAPSDVALLPGVELSERDEWFGVYRNGQKIGHAHRVTARTGDGYRFFEDSVMALAMLGTPQTVRTSMAAETDAAFALRSFRFTLVSPATVFKAAGTTDGRRMSVTYGPESHSDEMEIALTEPIYLPSTLRPRVLAGERIPGTHHTVPVFSPLTLQSEPMTVTIEGREALHTPEGAVETIRLVEEYQGIRTHSWLDDSGTVVREEAALGFTLERETRDRALALIDTLAPIDLATGSRIPFTGSITDPLGATHLTIRVGGAAAMRIPDDPPRQQVRGERVEISREAVPPEGTVALASLRPSSPVADFAAPAPFIESDDPEVVRTARSIVGNTQDATAAARRLVAWVYTHVEKTPSVTVPSAREVLRGRRGDCNEHAVLLTALARAAGIPARVVAGAVYAGDGFYYHAWTEVWLGSWVSADGAFGQMPADATHVKLLDGGLERHMALASVIGKLTFALEEPVRHTGD